MRVYAGAYSYPDNILRASVLADPAGTRTNTGDNTPAVIHMTLVPGDTVEIALTAKGGGSENKAKMAMLNPSDNIVEWVKKHGANHGSRLVPAGYVGYRHWRHGRKSHADG